MCLEVVGNEPAEMISLKKTGEAKKWALNIYIVFIRTFFKPFIKL